jgi:hypothetical protein
VIHKFRRGPSVLRQNEASWLKQRLFST